MQAKAEWSQGKIRELQLELDENRQVFQMREKNLMPTGAELR